VTFALWVLVVGHDGKVMLIFLAEQIGVEVFCDFSFEAVREALLLFGRLLNSI